MRRRSPSGRQRRSGRRPGPVRGSRGRAGPAGLGRTDPDLGLAPEDRLLERQVGNDLDPTHRAHDVDVEVGLPGRIARARAGDGPSLIEVKTDRLWGHFEGDAQAYRGAELDSLDERDPIPAYADRLKEAGVLTDDDVAEFTQRLRAAIEPWRSPRPDARRHLLSTILAPVSGPVTPEDPQNRGGPHKRGLASPEQAAT